MLLPIKIALNILPELSVIFNTILARLLPSSAKERIRILFTVVKAVSADEKNADNPSSINNTTICMAALGSTDTSLLLKIKYLYTHIPEYYNPFYVNLQEPVEFN